MTEMYNPRKASQVIAALALKTGDRTLNVLKAVKLVYLVDRHSIQSTGFPVLDERRCSMPHGPVNSETYSHINGEHDLTESGWSDFLEDRANHRLAVVDGVDEDALDELSDADFESIEAVWAQFGGMNQWQLRDWTHDRRNVPEWEDPQGGSRTIPIERIMAMVGMENSDEHAELVEDFDRIDRVFASLH